MSNCSFPGAPPKDMEYAEPPKGTKPGFFSCANCIYGRIGGPRGGICGFSRSSQKPPFNVNPAGCCRFQASKKWGCGIPS